MGGNNAIAPLTVVIAVLLLGVAVAQPRETSYCPSQVSSNCYKVCLLPGTAPRTCANICGCTLTTEPRGSTSPGTTPSTPPPRINPHTTPSTTPGKTPDTTSGTNPGKTPETTPETTPDTTPRKPPGRTSETTLPNPANYYCKMGCTVSTCISRNSDVDMELKTEALKNCMNACGEICNNGVFSSS